MGFSGYAAFVQYAKAKGRGAEVTHRIYQSSLDRIHRWRETDLSLVCCKMVIEWLFG